MYRAGVSWVSADDCRGRQQGRRESRRGHCEVDTSAVADTRLQSLRSRLMVLKQRARGTRLQRRRVPWFRFSRTSTDGSPLSHGRFLRPCSPASVLRLRRSRIMMRKCCWRRRWCPCPWRVRANRPRAMLCATHTNRQREKVQTAQHSNKTGTLALYYVTTTESFMMSAALCSFMMLHCDVIASSLSVSECTGMSSSCREG